MKSQLEVEEKYSKYALLNKILKGEEKYEFADNVEEYLEEFNKENSKE